MTPVSFLGLVLCRRLAVEHQDILRKVKDFRIQSAICNLEADREVVEGNVAAFIQCLGLASQDDSAEHALEIFNSLVRERVPGALQHSLGRLGLRYQTVASMSCVFLLRPFDTINAYLHGERQFRSIVGEVVGSWTLGLATIPLAVAGVLYIAANRPAQRLGCNAFTALLLSKHTVLMILVFGSWYVCNVSIERARKRTTWIALCAGIVVVLTVATAYVYLHPSLQRVQRPSIGGLSERLQDGGGGQAAGRDAAQEADGHAAEPRVESA
uniref:Uncharacterized protein n=1 Tax=Alexandrium monilatum TaxID=311494 RepID=A0A7S4SJD9_9DINO